jgi:hypothetical protein
MARAKIIRLNEAITDLPPTFTTGTALVSATGETDPVSGCDR